MSTDRKPYCPDCNGVGMSHCSDPEHCGGVIYPEIFNAHQEAYKFVCWYRQMVMTGQIVTSKYAIDRIPCSDYELQRALTPNSNTIRE